MLSPEFLITSLIVVLIPGTGVIYTVSTGLFQGYHKSMAAALGCTLGIVPHLLACILGVTAFVHMGALAFQVVKYAGVSYLFYISFCMWRDTGGINLDKPEITKSSSDILIRGILINILNPKLSIFFLAFMPQFIVPSLGSPLPQLLMLSLVFMVMTLVVFVVYGLFATTVRSRFLSSPGALIWLKRSFAACFAVLGLKLATVDH